ncbi:MAG: NAD-dependent epimerase [Burkholderiales bacterium]
MKTLVTGAAGFIGMHVAQTLLARGEAVVGIDNLNDYYDVSLKQARLARLSGLSNFNFEHLDVAQENALRTLFEKHSFTRVVHLAAQAGVRYSISHPKPYGSANLMGFLSVLECCRETAVQHLVYASSSSVYGGNTGMPFRETDAVDHPVSLYAATKKANELMAHSYSHLYRIPTTGLRFFTVYGPWGRPDMSPTLFARAIFEGRAIDVYNHGKMQRDFTYIDDIVEGVIRVLDKPATVDAGYDSGSPNAATSNAPWRIFNIGNHDSVDLLRYIGMMEQAIGKPAIRNMKPMQPGDVVATYADVSALSDWVGFVPATPLHTGVAHFVDWVRHYYRY